MGYEHTLVLEVGFYTRPRPLFDKWAQMGHGHPADCDVLQQLDRTESQNFTKTENDTFLEK
jgi:hypothetical protein